MASAAHDSSRGQGGPTDPRLRLTASQAVGLGIFVYLGVTVLLFHLLLSGGTTVAGGPPDNEQHVWELGWWAFALTHGVNPFFTNYLTPAGHPLNLMWNNMTPVLAVLALPLTLLLGPIGSFNVLMVLAIWGTATSAFLCLRLLGGNPWAAWFGGLLFGFSPFMITNASSGRLPWTSLFVLPVVFLLGWKLVVQRRGSRWLLGTGLGIAGAVQLLLSEEFLLTTALVAVLMVILLGAAYRKEVSPAIRYAGPPVVWAAVVGVLICGYPLAMQFLGPGHAIHGTVIPVEQHVSSLLSALIPTPYQLLHIDNLFIGVQQMEIQTGLSSTYLGLPLIALLLFMALRQYRDPVTWWALVLVAVAFVISLGAHLHVAGSATRIPLPWDLLRHLPLMSLVVPGRVIVFCYFGAALVIVRFGVVQWPSLSLPVRSVVVALLLVTLTPAGALPVTSLVTPRIFRSSSSNLGMLHGMVALVPVPDGDSYDQARTMVWQAEGGFRIEIPWGNIIQGGAHGAATLYVRSTLARALVTLQDGGRLKLTGATLDAMRQELNHWHVTAVVVGPTSYRRRVVSLFDELLGGAPTSVGGAQLWRV
ncbi:MAG: hypothetical protein ACRENX_00665 [Candidatus Dormibacteria bacterium]